MNISFKKNLSKSYMVIEKVRTFSEQDFMVKMLFRNHIPGLLLAESESINGEINLLYDISSRQALFKLFEMEKMSFEQVRNLIFSIRFLILTLEEHLLDENNIILKKECIFADPKGERFEFCYFPYYRGNLMLELKELFSAMFSLVDFGDEKAVRLVQEIQKEVQRENFTVDTLLSVYEKAAEHALPVVEKAEPFAPAARPSLKEERNPAEFEEVGDYEDDATFLERARYYLKGKKPMDVLEDINSGGILSRIRQCGKAPDVPKAFEPSSLPIPSKPAFEYILFGEEEGMNLAEENRYRTGSEKKRRQAEKNRGRTR